MTQIPSPKTLACAVILAGLTAVPGSWTLSQTPMNGLGFNFGDGMTQRLYQDRFEDTFPLTQTLATTWAALRLGVFGEPAEGAVLGRDGVLFTAEEFTAPKDAQDLFAALHTARQRIEAAGAELVPVIVPDKARMRADALPRDRSAHFETRYDTLLDGLSAAGYRAIDLRPALAPMDSFLVTDTHWSPEGADRVARTLADRLADIALEATAFETTRTGERAFDGDLLAFADTGSWRDIAGPRRETIATFETLATDETDLLGQSSDQSLGLSLFDAPTIPVTLVGTSYSARSAFHFDGFLKTHFQADVLTLAREGKGPFVPMTEFLAGPALEESQPRLVLWEIPERYITSWSLTQ